MSENPDLARACDEAGITFVGPHDEALKQLGDKTFARNIAQQVNVPVLGGSDAIASIDEGRETCRSSWASRSFSRRPRGAAAAGCAWSRARANLSPSFEQAQRESLAAFGSPDVFIEKFITPGEPHRGADSRRPARQPGASVTSAIARCSGGIRKSSKSPPLPISIPAVRQHLCDAAIKIGRAVNYENAGTVEFLVDRDTNQFYFIEVNPRIQVEHTVTEEVTGIDIVKSQILVAQGMPLSDPEIGLPIQEAVRTNGFAMQCRVTTEDPTNNFHARLWPHRPLPLGQRHGHSARRRHGFQRGDRQSVLRFAAGESHAPAAGALSMPPPDGALLCRNFASAA